MAILVLIVDGIIKQVIDADPAEMKKLRPYTHASFAVWDGESDPEIGASYDGEVYEAPPPVERQVIREVVKILKELHQEGQITVSPDRIAALQRIKEGW